MICTHQPEFAFAQLHPPSKGFYGHIVKTRFIHLSLYRAQHSNIPVLQHSGKML
jgi:hypothetical protein